MSIRIMTEIWEYSPSSGTELLMMLAIADHANDDRECWPSIARLATGWYHPATSDDRSSAGY